MLRDRRPLDAGLEDSWRSVVGTPDSRDYALSQELAYGVARWLTRLDVILAQLLERPLRPRDIDVKAALLLGLYQLERTRIPEHAAVSTTVELSRYLKKAWAKQLLNGCLRQYLRRREAIERTLASQPEYEHGHPAWLADRIRAAWPAEAAAILAANQARGPMTLRVNARQTAREAYQARLLDAGHTSTWCPHAPLGLSLQKPVPVTALPNFADGICSVQDQAAQLAAPLLPAGMSRVLDACAAPGGKATHILERYPDVKELVCVEISPSRAQVLNQSLQRLQLTATVLVADAGSPKSWWNGQPFDAILLDAPCSATGVIRRHPDIKYLRHPQDVQRLADTQLRILAGLWPSLVPGGRLLYATCSILPAENDGIVQRFVASTRDAVVEAIAAEWGRATACGRQILPGENDMDGFYYACIAKTA